jgi:hypothetical protein
MMGALSLFDFSIYELIHYVAEVFPLHENSPHAIKAVLPSQVKVRVKIE